MFKFENTLSIDTLIQLLYMSATVAMFWYVRRTDEQGWKKLRIQNANNLVQMFEDHLTQKVSFKHSHTNQQAFEGLFMTISQASNSKNEIDLLDKVKDYFPSITDAETYFELDSQNNKNLISPSIEDAIFFLTTLEIAEFIASQVNEKVAEGKVVIFEIGQYLEILYNWAKLMQQNNPGFIKEWRNLKLLFEQQTTEFKFPQKNHFFID